MQPEPDTSRDLAEATSPSASAPQRAGARIEAVDLTRRFGRHLALDHLSLKIEPGEAFGLLGANGAGKTTFIRLVTGYLLPSEGHVTVDGYSAVSHAKQVRARLGFVAETSRLYPDLRVRSFLLFAGGARGLDGDQLHAAVEARIAAFHLETVQDRPVGHLSKGFQQRVSLAQAFLHHPPLVIVDEPTGGLDPLQQAEVREVLRKLRGQQTTLLCTHDLAEARELTQRVAILHRGRLVAAGRTAELLDRHDTLDLFRGTGFPETSSSETRS